MAKHSRSRVRGSQALLLGLVAVGNALLSTWAQGQVPNLEEQKKLAREYVQAEAGQLQELGARLKSVPALTKNDVATWTAWLKKEMKTGPKLATKGTNYFYDEKAKRGKYIVSGGSNTKGLVFGLHGGGEGSADCTGAASSFRGAVEGIGMVGIYPEAIEATEAAWGDDVTVKFLMDLLVAAKRTFNVDWDRVYVVGHSMGGYGAWTWGGRFSDRLAAVASFAGAPTPIWGEGKSVIGIQPGVLSNFRNVPLWVYHSTDDPRVPIPPVQFAIREIKELKAAHPEGFDFVYEEVEKRGHDFPAKGPGPGLKWIATKTRSTRPKNILWEPFYERPDQSYWLAADRPKRGELIEARWDGTSKFEVTGTGAKDDTGIAVLLNESMVDFSKPVSLKIHGKVAFEGLPTHSLLTLLDSYRARQDLNLLFTARIPSGAR